MDSSESEWMKWLHILLLSIVRWFNVQAHHVSLFIERKKKSKIVHDCDTVSQVKTFSTKCK